MKRKPVGTLLVTLLCPLLLALAGCGRTETARFYTLHALTDARPERLASASGEDIAVGLGPVQLPAYLDRPQIVTRKNPNEVGFAEFHRWAGPLAADVSRILAENLSLLLDTNDVALYPWRSTTPIDYRIEIDILRMDGRPGDRITLHSRWAIFSSDRGREWAARTSTLSEPVNGNGYEALVAAQSRALAALSREIAEAVEGLPQGEALRRAPVEGIMKN